MKQTFYILGTILILVSIALTSWWVGKNDILTPNTKPAQKAKEVIEKPLEKYAIKNLNQIQKGKIEIKEENLFEFSFNPNLDGKTTKKTTGQVRIPEGEGSFPIVVMLRGYVDQTIYQTGVGTSRAAEYFSENGLITLAPDFLGYAGSDSEASDIFEARFQTYVTTISLLNSLDQIDAWDGQNIFLWGHSNGGQIALTVLEATGWDYPTVLWAPVSKSFPYSILYYTDESEDRGKFIRQELAKFEELYNADLFSIHQYYGQIKAPIQLHQGTADDAVPVEWSNKLAKNLNLDLNQNYFQYSGSDHNLRPAWDTIVVKNLAFFRQNMVE